MAPSDPVPDVNTFDNLHNLQDGNDHRIKDVHEDDSNAAQLRRLIGVQETEDWKSVNSLLLQQKMHVLTCAAMALDMDDRKHCEWLTSTFP